jgi:tetratricopeptide (TPR) repeat protein
MPLQHPPPFIHFLFDLNMQHHILIVSIAIIFLRDYYPSLLSSSSSSFVVNGDTSGEAGKFRTVGDGAFVKDEWNIALENYGKAIALEPDNALNFYKRFRVFDKMKKTSKALGDLNSVIILDPKHVQALALRARTYQNMGKCQEAAADYETVLRLKPDHGDAKKMIDNVRVCAGLIKRAEILVEQGSAWDKVEELLTEAMKITGGTTPHLKMMRAKARLEKGDYHECIADAGEVVKIESENVEALLLRGRAYYYTADHEMTMRHLREALKFDPEHIDAKKLFNQLKRLIARFQAGEEAFKKGDFKEALQNYEASVEIDPEHREFNKHTYLKICRTLTKLKEIDKAMGACDMALEIDNSLIDAHIIIAEHLTSTAETSQDFEIAVMAWNKALQMDRNNGQAQEGLRRAEAALKQSKQKNYYKTLSVPRNADAAEIKKSYRKLALAHHPGKFYFENDSLN